MASPPELAERLLAFELRDEAWPKGRTAIKRAEIGRQREEALSEVVPLRDRIAGGRAATLADAAVQLRRLVVMADEAPRPHALLASADARRLAVRLRARVTVPLLPKRALTLAQELLTRGVQGIKADS